MKLTDEPPIDPSVPATVIFLCIACHRRYREIPKPHVKTYGDNTKRNLCPVCQQPVRKGQTKPTK